MDPVNISISISIGACPDEVAARAVYDDAVAKLQAIGGTVSPTFSAWKPARAAEATKPEEIQAP